MRQRLKGAAVASYYPPRIGTIAQLRSLYPQHEILDEDEEDWIEHLNVARSRGKAVPKKKRTAAGTLADERLESRGWELTHHRIEEVQQEEVDGHTPHDTHHGRRCIAIVHQSIGRRSIRKRKCQYHTGLIPYNYNSHQSARFSICTYNGLDLTFQPQSGLSVCNTVLFLEFVIPGYPRAQMIWQYRAINLVVLHRAEDGLSIKTCHLAPDHGHLLPYTHHSADQPYCSANWNCFEVRDVK